MQTSRPSRPDVIGCKATRGTLVALSLLAGCTSDSAGLANDATDDGVSTDTGEDDAGAWELSYSADPPDGALMSVWGRTSDAVFAVGGQPPGSSASSGTVLRFDGQAWTRESLPADTRMLNWVFGNDDGIWAVGLGGSIVRRDDATDPPSWTTESSGTDRTLWGVWGTSADEMWAVGGNGISDDPVLLRRDASGWAAVALPTLSVEAHGLFKVWGRDRDDVWFVGDQGLALHWNGNALEDVSTDASTDLISVWGGPDGEVLAVGGRANAHFARWEGDGWSTETTIDPGLNGVWIGEDGAATVVGNGGQLMERAAGASTFQATEPQTPMVLHATYGFDGGPAFAVGGTLLAPTPWLGVILMRR